MNPILVTGGTGKTGRHVVSQLLEHGQTPRVASRNPDGPDGAQTVTFDWAEESTWGPALDSVTQVYLIPPTMSTDPSGITTGFLSQATAAGVDQVVLLSANGVQYGPQDQGLGLIERLVRDTSPRWTLLRPGWFNQNFSESFWKPTIAADGVVPHAAGEGQVAFVDTHDIAAVGVAALLDPDAHAGQAYTITGPEAITFVQVAATLSQATGREILADAKTPEDMVGWFTGAGMPAEYAQMLTGMMGMLADGGGAQVSDDVEKATGRPARPFAAYAREHAQVWKTE